MHVCGMLEGLLLDAIDQFQVTPSDALAELPLYYVADWLWRTRSLKIATVPVSSLLVRPPPTRCRKWRAPKPEPETDAKKADIVEGR